jgi:hypothetical protein
VILSNNRAVAFILHKHCACKTLECQIQNITDADFTPTSSYCWVKVVTAKGINIINIIIKYYTHIYNYTRYTLTANDLDPTVGDGRRKKLRRGLARSTLFVDDSAKIDKALFGKMPKDVQALNRAARAEARARARYDWALNNPSNPRVAGKPLKKPV